MARGSKMLSPTATRILRAIIANAGKPGYAYALKVAAGNRDRVGDALKHLESRFLIRWDIANGIVSPSRRGLDLLNSSAYRDYGLL